MAESTIQDVTNLELLELNRRKKQKANRIEGNYDTARVMNQEIVNERKENQQTKIWHKEVHQLLRLDPELFATSKKRAVAKKSKQLIVKLRVRQQEQEQEQERQSGRGMRIKRAPKRSY